MEDLLIHGHIVKTTQNGLILVLQTMMRSFRVVSTHNLKEKTHFERNEMFCKHDHTVL